MLVLVVTGWYAISLSYMSPWVKPLLDWHQALGITVFALGIGLMGWHTMSRPPAHVPTLTSPERLAARIVHLLLYASLIIVPITGYVAATEDGPIVLFGIALPPLPMATLNKSSALALTLHWYTGYGIMVVAGLHALAALKHHILNRDETLLRMLGGKRPP